VQIQRISAANYDAIYWQHIETGDRYHTDDINFTATDAKTTYMITATNNDCAALVTDQVEILTINPTTTSGIQGVILRKEPTNSSYCSGAINLKDYEDIISIGLLEANGTYRY